MRLFHGTNVRFEHIDLAQSKPNKDFGPGFYLSDDREQAVAMAESKVMMSGGVPQVIEFEFDAEQATGLKVLRFDEYSREWAEFIVMNRDRNVRTKRHDYDFVYGPIANDRIGLQVQLFMQDYIDIDTLLKRIKFVRPTFQYYFGTSDAIKLLKLL
ncbi:MAG: DUF3990 domain-containing protein [Bacteroidaceae bacterium]|nr:DUF3990 domain-containing protein [Bacteroidaceae bacterium]